MQTRYDLLLEMSGFLDRLLDTVKSLNEAAKHAHAEEAIVRLQHRQDEILSQIDALNTLLKDKKIANDRRAASIQKEVAAKLMQFQEQNRLFVKLVQDRHRMIEQKILPTDILQDLE